MTLSELSAAYKSGGLSKPDYINGMHGIHSVLFEYAEYLKGSAIAGIEITDGQVVLTARETGIKIICDRRDKRVAPIEILNFGPYEEADAEMMFRLLDDGLSIFDIGANVGWYSLNFAKSFPRATVNCFEPIAETFRYLKANLALNQASRVTAHNLGFSNRAGEQTFFFDPSGSGGASAADLQETGAAPNTVCQLTRLDSFVEESGLGVDFIKCDVEGAELFVFEGGLKTLEKFKPIVFTEMLRKWTAKFDYHPNRIIELFGGLGYRCFAASHGKLIEFTAMDEATLQTNFFFLHQETHREKIQRATA